MFTGHPVKQLLHQKFVNARGFPKTDDLKITKQEKYSEKATFSCLGETNWH